MSKTRKVTITKGMQLACTKSFLLGNGKIYNSVIENVNLFVYLRVYVDTYGYGFTLKPVLDSFKISNRNKYHPVLK